MAINTLIPEVYTCDMAWWHVIIEPEAGVDVPDESHVTVTAKVLRSSEPTRLCSYPTLD